ncbi:Protein of unknown function [Pseudomonas benzenivorans]|nr:DUF3465 domain-containing protein [Pseudomonas benzenivorans]SDH03478.1 Protein of unknown function [Pseudomonas benzenivorans]
MKKIIAVLLLAALAYALVQARGLSIPGFSASPPATSDSSAVLAQAYVNRQSDIQVEGVGIVVKVLADDRDGSRHQRFILRLANGQTLLVAHNIDLAPRIHELKAGDDLGFYGEYEWNAQGGVIHWTHHDPGGRHVAGWLKHGGRIYQ